MPEGENPTAVEEDVASSGNGHVPDDERNNLLGKLKGIRKKIATSDFKKDVDIPGYQGLLVARFRPYAIAKTERKADKLRERQQRDEPILLDASCDTLIDSLEQMYVRNDAGKLLPIDDAVPVKFDERLAELMELEVPPPPRGTARSVVKALFPTEQAIIATSMEVTRWLNDVTREINEEALGE